MAIIERAEVDELEQAWKDPSIPERQLVIARDAIVDWLIGRKVEPFNALERLLYRHRDFVKILEVGCGVGHNVRVIRAWHPLASYVGLDYSEPMIGIARREFGSEGTFFVASAYSTAIVDLAFDLVLHGGCLPHMRDWEIAMKEAARISRHYVLFHRTPIRQSGRTRVISHKAYDVRCFLKQVSREDWDRWLKSVGLCVVDNEVWNVGDDPEQCSFLCEKV